jgi:hypothetical protein
MRGKLSNSVRSQSKTRISSLESLDDSGDINRVWDIIRENTNISAKESIGRCEAKHRKPRFDEECSKFVDRRKRAKLQWLQDPGVVSEDNT